MQDKNIDSEELKQILNHVTFYAKLNYRHWDADDTRAFYFNDSEWILTGATFYLNSDLGFQTIFRKSVVLWHLFSEKVLNFCTFSVEENIFRILLV